MYHPSMVIRETSSIFLTCLLVVSALAAFGPPTSSPGKEIKGPPLPGTSALSVQSAEVVLIPMHGTFGFEGDAEEGVWIDPDAFKALVRQAQSLHPKFVVLDIESPGGFVSVMHVIAETLMKSFPAEGTTQVVAWPGMAGSAASFVTLACPKIVVKPLARVGAALTVVPTPKGMVAVDDLPEEKSALQQKYKSFSDALERSAIQYGGHPPEVRAAMAIQSAALFWSPSQRRFFAVPPDPKNRGDLIELDSPQSVLTFTAKEMVAYGLASVADDEAGLLRALGLPETTTMVRLGADLPEWFEAVRRAYGPSLADDAAKIQPLLDAFRTGLDAYLKFDREVDTIDAKRKANVSDKDRSRDVYVAARQLAVQRRNDASKQAGQAATALKEIVKRLEKAKHDLAVLGVSEPTVLPQSALFAPRIQASLNAHKAGDLTGAITILAGSR